MDVTGFDGDVTGFRSARVDERRQCGNDRNVSPNQDWHRRRHACQVALQPIELLLVEAAIKGSLDLARLYAVERDEVPTALREAVVRLVEPEDFTGPFLSIIRLASVRA